MKVEKPERAPGAGIRNLTRERLAAELGEEEARVRIP